MNYNNPRIGPDDSGLEILVKMAGGNPGAITVLMKIVAHNRNIDPDDAFAAFGPMLSMDMYEIYEGDIWILYKDVCDENLPRMLALLRSSQLGISSETELKSLMKEGFSADRGRIDELVSQVKQRLPSFQLDYPNV